ncbi:MAG TPA: response regulator [Vicinamibacterales bacterium]|nr:response regulator [Vicinamibacterales bacterium]
MAHTLLLADDSVTIQRVIELTFADEDIRVVAVSDGSQAIAALDRDRPDIVLADVSMPGQNGYDVARHVRATPSLASIPVVLLTGAFEPVDQAKVAETGCDGVLAKPFEPQMVISRVKELLSRGSAASSSTQTPAPVSTPEVAEDPGRESIAEYFDRLDSFTGQTPAAPVPPLHAVDTARGPESERTPEVERTPEAERATEREPARAVAVSFPPIADAFAALLDAEQSGAPAPVVQPWANPAATPELPPDFLEQVTRRVLDQMSDRLVRERVNEIVTSVAERLVREEIDRIKKAVEGNAKR